jgi:hypothetical protein
MRRVVTPLIVVAIFGFVSAILYRHLWDDPAEAPRELPAQRLA